MEAWLEALPDDLKNEPTLASFKDVPALARSLVETKKMVGSSIRPPGPDATADQRKEYIAKVLATAPELMITGDEEAMLKALGRPEKIEDYTVDEAVAKSIDLEAARAQAQKAGLTRKQFQALAAQTAEARAAAVAAFEAEHGTLKQEWGVAHADRVLAAAVVARKMGKSDEAVAAIAAGKVPASVLRDLYQTSKLAGVETKEISLERANGGGPPRLDPSEAKAQIAEIQGNPAYWNKSVNPALHEQLKQKVVKLTEMTLQG
jgi:hypothetical protein